MAALFSRVRPIACTDSDIIPLSLFPAEYYQRYTLDRHQYLGRAIFLGVWVDFRNAQAMWWGGRTPYHIKGELIVIVSSPRSPLCTTTHREHPGPLQAVANNDTLVQPTPAFAYKARLPSTSVYQLRAPRIPALPWSDI